MWNLERSQISQRIMYCIRFNNAEHMVVNIVIFIQLVLNLDLRGFSLMKEMFLLWGLRSQVLGGS